MKKLLTYLLTFAMLITILIPAMEPALAEDNVPVPVAVESASTQSKDVLADVTALEIADVFYVELTWGSMKFNINDTGPRTYNPNTGLVEYIPSVTVEPENTDANKVKLRNKSNFKVLSTTTLEDNTSGQINGTFTGAGTTTPTTSSNLHMPAYYNQEYTYTFNFEATDIFKMQPDQGVKIATVNVGLSKSTA